jgi:hypothetical protein
MMEKRFLVNLGVAVAAEEKEAGVEAAVKEEEEASVEVAEEEISSSGIDGSGGDRRSRERWSRERRGLREFLDEKQNDMGLATIYRFKNISNSSLTTTDANSFRIQTETVLV